MQATFAAGATVSMVFREPRRHHKVKATVAGATDAAILLDLGEAGARPAHGADVTLIAGSRIFETIVNRVDDRWATVRRPELLRVEDQRRSIRTPTRLSIRWRVSGHAAAPMSAAYVVDLSSRGARVLAEADDQRAIGTKVEVDVGRHRFDGWIRRSEPHEHGQLQYYGVEFAEMTPETQSYVWKTLGKVRIGEHDWA